MLRVDKVGQIRPARAVNAATVGRTCANTPSITAFLSVVLYLFQENLAVRVYTRGLLIPLATPDFSMPYNVITLTSTVIAMIFSSLFNALLQKGQGAEAEPGGNARPGEWAGVTTAGAVPGAESKDGLQLWFSVCNFKLCIPQDV